LIAVSRVDVFVTNDRDLRNAAKQEVEKGRLKLQVWNYEEFLKQLKILDVSRLIASTLVMQPNWVGLSARRFEVNSKGAGGADVDW
jgi:hypothetical protein